MKYENVFTIAFTASIMLWWYKELYSIDGWISWLSFIIMHCGSALQPLFTIQTHSKVINNCCELSWHQSELLLWISYNNLSINLKPCHFMLSASSVRICHGLQWQQSYLSQSHCCLNVVWQCVYLGSIKEVAIWTQILTQLQVHFSCALPQLS